jgi:hypothetical protein
VAQVPLPSKSALAARGVAGHGAAAARRRHRAQVCHDARRLLVREVGGGHARVRDALLDDADQIRIGLRALELPAAEIDART